MSNIPLDEKTIFAAAIDIESIDDRSDYVRNACGDNRQLYDRVMALLEVYDQGPSIFDYPLTLRLQIE